MLKSYDYKHRNGLRKITWDHFAQYSKNLAEMLSHEGIDVIIGIARAGLLPATAVACMLRKEMVPIRLTRRSNDEVVSEKPIWKVELPKNILTDQVVAIIDEIADTGQTLSMVSDHAFKMGAKRVVTASLVSHTWAKPKPDFIILETDELVLFPWDYMVFIEGKWQIHPEYAEAIGQQK